MARSCLYAFVVLYSSLKGTYGVNYQCEKLEERTCFGSSLDFNFTTTALVTDSQTQLDIRDKLKQWEGLKFLSRCWSVLQPLLCQVYKPRCHNSSVQLPCREQCLATRTPCSVVERYNEEWPEFLKCERFPLGGCKGGSVSRELNCVIIKNNHIKQERKAYSSWPISRRTICRPNGQTNVCMSCFWNMGVHLISTGYKRRGFQRKYHL